MALYRLHLKHITRSRGLSAHAHARYITRNDTRALERSPSLQRSASAHAAYIDRSGTSGGGAYRDDLVHVEHANMPAWARDTPQEFWKAADTYERANGRLYSEMELALPRELSPLDRLSLVREFVHHEIGQRHPYSFAIHNAKALDGGEQPHAHIMFSTRVPGGVDREASHFFARANNADPERGGAAKDTTWYAKATLQQLRRDWEDIANRTLERAGLDIRIDHRSLTDQGIDRAPEPHMGKDHTEMLRKGTGTDVAAEVMQLRKDREHSERLERALITTATQLEEAQRERDRRHARAEELLARPRDPESARQRFHASREERRERVRSAMERDTGIPHRFTESGEVTGTAIDRVAIGRESFVRLEESGSAQLVPWHDDFHALMGKMLHIAVSENSNLRRVRLVRILDREQDLERRA